MHTSNKFLLAGLSAVMIFFGCAKNSNTNNTTATSGYVDVTIDLSLPQNTKLNPVSGSLFYPAGLRNIIVYHKSATEFVAYDAACTYKPTTACGPLRVDVTGLYIVDTCKNCGSKFYIVDGGVNKPPASIPLTRYQTTWDGANLVRVFN